MPVPSGEDPSPGAATDGVSLNAALLAQLDATGAAHIGTWSEPALVAAGAALPPGPAQLGELGEGVEVAGTAFSKQPPAVRRQAVAAAYAGLVASGQLLPDADPALPGRPAPGSPLALIRTAPLGAPYSGLAAASRGGRPPDEYSHFYGVRRAGGDGALLELRVLLGASRFDYTLRTVAGYVDQLSHRFFATPGPQGAVGGESGDQHDDTGPRAAVLSVSWLERTKLRTEAWTLVRLSGRDGPVWLLNRRPAGGGRASTEPTDEDRFRIQLDRLFATMATATLADAGTP